MVYCVGLAGLDTANSFVQRWNSAVPLDYMGLVLGFSEVYDLIVWKQGEDVDVVD